MIRNTYPLFCPQILYKDRFGGNLQPFLEMNPSIFFDSDENQWIVLVRGVNYRKFKNNIYTCYVHPLHSIYWIGRGSSLDALSWEELKYDFGNLPQHSSYWNGVEDIRFLNREEVICCVPQLNPGGRPALFTAKIDYTRNILTYFTPCLPNQTTEKNWMPFERNQVIYSVSPLILKDVHEDKKEEIPLTPNQRAELEGYHGSTNGVLLTDDSWLFLIHKNKTNKVEHRWLRIHSNKTITFSPSFTFFKDPYIEFPCGLVLKEDALFVSLGVNDCQAFVVELDLSSNIPL